MIDITLAIVGRPNVGKSTLFNALTKTREALVADQPGLTRDRKIGKGQVGNRNYWLIDTGGLGEEETMIGERITQQALLAVADADAVLFLVDGRSGLTGVDEQIAQTLRQFNTPIHLIINKCEQLDGALISADFHQLGFADVYTISAAHRLGIESLMEMVLASFPEQPVETTGNEENEEEERIKVAVIGRPNVGKSTLINRLLGYERVIAFDQPGTTRDSIFIPFERDGQLYTLIDTAGVRRRAKISETIEKFSVIKALQTIELTDVSIMLLDGQEGMTDQDANLLGYVLEAGSALVIAVNKWDGLAPDHREQVRYHLKRKLHFIDFADIHFISALHGSGVGHLFDSINRAWQAAHQRISTTWLNQLLQEAITANAPPMIHGRRIKLRYVHQGDSNPPVFVIHGNQLKALPEAYQRYLINFFRDKLNLMGTPIRLELRQGENPFQGRKNTLTPRQQRKRKRLLHHAKRKK